MISQCFQACWTTVFKLKMSLYIILRQHTLSIFLNLSLLGKETGGVDEMEKSTVKKSGFVL